MTKISRYILVLTTIVLASIVLPELFWMSFDKPIRVPLVQYSCIIDDFAIFNSEDGSRTDAAGNTYTRNEYEKILPLMYSRQLMIDECFPDSINGVETDLHKISTARNFMRIKPNDFQSPLPRLYPLFESESGRANLSLPNDVFRIDWRMEFIDANTNKIDEEKSRLFSAALFHNDFEFPAKRIAGLPTVRKTCDEGYLVVDSKNQLFHIKMIKGNPFIKKVDLPDGLTLKHINCVDFKDKRYYAYLIGNDNGIYILTQDDYKVIRWPINTYIPEEDQIRIRSNYFNYCITIISDDKQQTIALDKGYNLIDTYEYTWTPREDRTIGEISASVFPFEFSLSKNTSRYVKFYPKMPRGFIWIIINLVFVACQITLIKKRKSKFFNQIVDLIIVGITGIFGFIAVNVFPNKLD